MGSLDSNAHRALTRGLKPFLLWWNQRSPSEESGILPLPTQRGSSTPSCQWVMSGNHGCLISPGSKKAVFLNPFCLPKQCQTKPAKTQSLNKNQSLVTMGKCPGSPSLIPPWLGQKRMLYYCSSCNFH